MSDVATLPNPLTVDFVRDEVLGAFDAKRGKLADWRIAGPVHVTRNCHIFRAEAAGFPCEIAVKIYTNLRKTRPLTVYAEALRRYHSGMSAESGLVVPREIDTQIERNAVLLEWIEGTTVRSELLTRQLTPAKRAWRVKMCAEWLRSFHEVTGLEAWPFDGAAMLERTEREMSELTPVFLDGPSGRSLTGGWELLAQQAKRLRNMRVPHSVLHGDFTTSNLMVRGDQLVGLDFEARRRRPVAHDICRFLIHLDICRWQATNLSVMDETAGDRRDNEAFTTGYGSNVMPQGSFFQLALLNELVRRVAIRSNPATGSLIARRVELSRLRRRLDLLVERMKAGG